MSVKLFVQLKAFGYNFPKVLIVAMETSSLANNYRFQLDFNSHIFSQNLKRPGMKETGRESK